MNLSNTKSISIVFVIVGTLYSFVVLYLGIRCVGFECIGWGIFGGIITVGGYPWSLLDQLLPKDFLVSPERTGVWKNPTTQLYYWPAFLIRYIGFMINLWILGTVLRKCILYCKHKHADQHDS